MVVIVLEKVPPSLRGELTRWLIEPKTGLFVGHVSALVRERLWEKCIKGKGRGGVIQIWTTNTEQRFDMRSWGDNSRQLVNHEGVWLIRKPPASESGADAAESVKSVEDALQKLGL